MPSNSTRRSIPPTDWSGAPYEERWEHALRQSRQVEEEYERFIDASPVRLSDAERKRIRAMATNIPALWSDPETTAVDRKEIVRCLDRTYP